MGTWGRRAGQVFVLGGLILWPVWTGFHYERVMAFALVMVIVAISLSIVTGLAGQASMGQAAFMAIGAYTSALLATRYGLSFWLSVPTAALCAGIAGVIVGLPSLRARGIFLAFVTLMFTLITWTALVNLAWLTGGMYGISGIGRPQIGPLALSGHLSYYYLILTVALGLTLMALRLARSRLGRMLIAVRDDEHAAAMLGLRPSRIKLLAFVFSAVYAGIGGALYAHLLGHISPESFPPSLSLEALMMIAIGGVYRIEGAILGALLVTLLPELLRFAKVFWNVLFGIILVATVVALPGGLVSLVDKLARRKRPTPRDAPPPAAALTPLPPRPVESALHPTNGFHANGSAARNHLHPGMSHNGYASNGKPHREEGAQAPLLQATDLTCHFGGITALDRVSFAVPAGSIYGVIGPNGAGKSVLFNVISGFTRAQGGCVTWRGQPMTDRTPAEMARAGLGRTFQEPHVFGSLTVLENILLASQAKDLWPHLRDYLRPGWLSLPMHERAAAEELVSAVGLSAVSDQPARQLSYGQQKLLSLANVLATGATCVLLDEPAAGVTAALMNQMAALIRTYSRQYGTTFVIAEHRMRVIVSLCEQVLVLDQGRVLAFDTPAALLRHPEVLHVYFGGSTLDQPFPVL